MNEKQTYLDATLFQAIILQLLINLCWSKFDFDEENSKPTVSHATPFHVSTWSQPTLYRSVTSKPGRSIFVDNPSIYDLDTRG